MIEKVEVYRITDTLNHVMYLSKLDRSIESLEAAIHHVELMPDSITIELNGNDGSKVIVTKPEAQQLLDEMRLLAMAEQVDAD